MTLSKGFLVSKNACLMSAVTSTISIFRSQQGLQTMLRILQSRIAVVRVHSAMECKLIHVEQLSRSLNFTIFHQTTTIGFCRRNFLETRYQLHHSMALSNVCMIYTLCLKKKRPTFKLSLTLSNLNRFSKFLHCWKAYEICYKSHMTVPTLP